MLVTNPGEIRCYLDGDYDNDQTYYYITTVTPDNRALDSLLDRTFGKATQTIVSEDEDGNKSPLKFVVEKS